jgi:hypothetical protein
MPESTSQTAASLGDLEALSASFRQHLRAANLAPKTMRTCMEAAEGLRKFLVERGMPSAVASITREHVEAYISDLLDRW